MERQIRQKSVVVINKDQIIPGTEFYRMWNVGPGPNYKAQVPIFNVYNMHGLNSMIGYVMLLNSEVGKVLYRGQNTLYCGDDGCYNDLLPSICHIYPTKGETKKAAKRRWYKEIHEKIRALDSRIKAIIDDSDLLKQVAYNFNPEDMNKRTEMEIVIESLLQHYGDSTRCMDFVDNHWIALWFGLYQWIAERKEQNFLTECFYKKRTLKLDRKSRQDAQAEIRLHFFNELKEIMGDTSVTQSQTVVNRLLKKYTHRFATAEDQFLYVLLFVANTLPEYETTQHAGVYSSSQMTVVDLRCALPSVFLRPGAQHGWTVKMNSSQEKTNRGDYSFAKNVVAILRVPVSLADELIGGALLSQENLFPPEDYDQGYRILLQRQELAMKKNENLTELEAAFKSMPIMKYK